MGGSRPFWRQRVATGIADYAPAVVNDYAGFVSGVFASAPAGWILHGSRSGGAGVSTDAEFRSTAHFATVEPSQLGWNATVGDDVVALHMTSRQWGWNARNCSPRYIGYEFAQSTEAEPIVDGQVRAFCWLLQRDREVWPTMPLVFKTHAEVDGTAEYGGFVDGKTDVFHKGSGLADELRRRIQARLAELGVT